MGNTLSIKQSIKAEDLETKLKKATSLSEDQIKEIVPVVLSSISEIKKLEVQKTESTTKENLLELNQSITNDSNVSIDMKNNKGTVIWTMNFNEITNHISITINNIWQQTPSISESSQENQSTTINEVSENNTTSISEQNQNTTTPETSENNTITSETTENNTPTTSEVSEQNQSTTINEASENNTTSISEQNQNTTTPGTSENNTITSETTENNTPTTSEVSEQNQNTTSSEISENNTTTVSESSENNTITASEISEQNQSSTNFENPFYNYKTAATSTIDIYTPNWLLIVLNELLEQIDDIKSEITKRGIWSSWKETMKNAKVKLKQYEKQIKAKKRALEKSIRKWNNIQIFDTDINHTKKLQNDIENVRNAVSEWQWWELSNKWPFLYNSPENARKANKQQERLNTFEKNIKQEIKDWAIKNIFNNHEEIAIDFYRRIAEWRYNEADYNVYKQNAWILNPSFQRCGINTPILMPQTIPSSWVMLNQWWPRMRQNIKTFDYSNLDRWETFQQWGIAWVIDKALNNCKNMTPWQRNTWKSIWVLWWFAAWIYWLYKFFTNKKMSFWWKAWLTAATIFWSQALTWEGPLSLFNKLMTWWFSKEYLEDKFWNAFWDAVNGLWNSWIESSHTLAPAMYSMMIFNPSTTVWDIRTQTNTFKSNENAWKDFHGYAITKLRNKYGESSTEHFSATFSDKFDEQKWNNRLASFWVTDSTVDSANIYELANNASMNEIIIEKFKEENWIKETDNEVKKKELHDYINNLKRNNQAIDIAVLKSHTNDHDRFTLDKEATYTDREIDRQNIKALENQVDTLSISDPLKKSELKTAIIRFYNERSIDTKPNLSDFNLKTENGFVILKSHSWQETEIDINKWELVWFWNWIRFSDLSELLNVADLSNRILETQKWKQPKDIPPFQYKMGKGWRWIYFNDAEIWSLNFDTRILSWGLWWSIGKIDTLSNPNNAEEFAKYLSKRWEGDNKVNLDSSNYPILHAFSEKTKIIFTNEQESKDLENWLKEIKDWKKFAIWQQGWNPFKISWQFKTFDNRLVFTAINWTKEVFNEDISEKFPTIMRNKDEFLKYMNDKNNWMRWSALNQ